jgi:hypothetical protein
MVDALVKQLKLSPARRDVFNPWYHFDEENEISKKGADIRRQQLRAYLQERVGKAKYLLLAEALGYQGGHFTGIAMTSERILLGHQKEKGIFPEHVFKTRTPKRTSKVVIKPQGFIEPTATIVWGAILEMGIDPRSVVLWNAYPWHPFKLDMGYQSNRTPGKAELMLGKPMLESLIDLMGFKKKLAIGNKAHQLLGALGIETVKARHPAMGGANDFRKQFKAFISSKY